MNSVVDNPTRAFIADIVASSRKEVPLDINPAFASLYATVEEAMCGAVSLRFIATKDTAQGSGVVGGGTLANMLDCGLAVATLSTLAAGQNCVTISLTVNMLRAAVIGPLYVKAKVDRVGKRVAFVHGQLFDPDDRLVATATSSLAII